MNSIETNFGSRIKRMAATGFVVASFGLALIGGGAAHAQDNATGFDGTPCTHNGTVYQHGDEITVGGKTYVCSFGTWVEKASIVVTETGGNVDTGVHQGARGLAHSPWSEFRAGTAEK